MQAVNINELLSNLPLLIEKLDRLTEASTSSEQSLTNKTYLSKREVAELVGVSEKSIDTMRRKAVIPEPKTIPISENSKGRTLLRWKKQEVMDWIDAY